MSSSLTEDLKEQFARSIGDLGLLVIARLAGHKAPDTNHLPDPLEIAHSRLGDGQPVENALAGTGNGSLRINLRGDAALGDQLAVLEGNLTRYEQEVPSPLGRHIGGYRGGRLGESAVKPSRRYTKAR